MPEKYLHSYRIGELQGRPDSLDSQRPSKYRREGTSLVVQGLTSHTPNAGGLGRIPGQGTRSLMLQLGVCSHN